MPAELPHDRACLLGCAVMTGVGAVTRVAQVEFGATVAVLGCGPVGLNVVQGARLVGAGTIVAADNNPERLTLATRLGATHTVDPRREDVLQVLQALTDGRGADYMFEAAGSEATMQSALEATRAGGTVVILGKVEPERQIGLRFGSLLGEKRIIRSSLGGAQVHDDFPALARAYLDGRLFLDDLISERLPLSDINEGFDRLSQGQSIRSVVCASCASSA